MNDLKKYLKPIIDELDPGELRYLPVDDFSKPLSFDMKLYSSTREEIHKWLTMSRRANIITYDLLANGHPVLETNNPTHALIELEITWKDRFWAMLRGACYVYPNSNEQVIIMVNSTNLLIYIQPKS